MTSVSLSYLEMELKNNNVKLLYDKKTLLNLSLSDFIFDKYSDDENYVKLDKHYYIHCNAYNNVIQALIHIGGVYMMKEFADKVYNLKKLND